MLLPAELKRQMEIFIVNSRCSLYVNYLIGYTNAHKPFSFSNAFIELYTRKEIGVVYQSPLHSIFRMAFKVLKNSLKIENTALNDDVLNTNQMSAVKCLIRFFEEFEAHQESLLKFARGEKVKETDVCAVLTAHLFSVLVPCDTGQETSVTLHSDMKGQHDTCPCGCGKRINYGNTGIGGIQIWHGCPDLLIKHSSAAISVRKPRKDSDITAEGPNAAKKVKKSSDDPGSSSSTIQTLMNDSYYTTEVKTHEGRVFDYDFSAQLISQSLTNGFAQKAGFNRLIPSIGCTLNEMIIYMYDPDRDLFLRRNALLPLITEGYLVPQTIIELWFILNLHTFGSSLSEKIASIYRKSGFRSFLERTGVLDFYKKAVVAVPSGHFSDSLSLLDTKFYSVVQAETIFDEDEDE